MAQGLAADGDGNGLIDAADYDLWRANFGRTAANASGATGSASASPAVPEPASAMLLFVASAIVAMRRVRR
jgi:hypothetical protein